MEEETNNNESQIEKPVKVYKRKFVFTKARQEAFERCKKAREDSIKTGNKSNKVKAVLKREERLKKKKEELGLVDPEPEPVQKYYSSSSSEEEVEKIEKPKPKKKTKKPKITIVESDTETEEEYEVRKVKKQRPKSTKYEEPPQQEEPQYIKSKSIYFL